MRSFPLPEASDQPVTVPPEAERPCVDSYWATSPSVGMPDEVHGPLATYVAVYVVSVVGTRTTWLRAPPSDHESNS